MTPRLLPLLLLVFSGFSATVAQEIRPLAGHDVLRSAPTKGPVATNDKMLCAEPDLSAFERITTGQGRELRIDLDTAGLGTFVDNIQCFGCDEADFGTVTLRNDTVIYDPNPDIEQGLDTLRFVACTATGVCTDTATLIILAQRAGRLIDLGGQNVDPGARIDIAVPDGDLPEGIVCRSITRCAPDYPGREQRFAFIGDINQGNNVNYVAARAGGTDSICVQLCNALGLCDTYRAGITIDRAPIDLPFFDDFSYDDTRPAAALWQDEDVLINDNFAQNPPSIGVATFDAVDFDGRPYAGNGTAFGTRDFLTSAPINMAGENGAVLSFWLQPRGLGNRPETRDSFLVQFLTVTGNWETVFQQQGRFNTESASTPIPFDIYSLEVPAAYLYDGFQFRFANKSNERGVVDNWHLDYVKLQNSSSNNRPEVTQDLALVEKPFYLTAPYTAVPIRHFQAADGALFGSEAFFKVYNHRDDVTAISQPLLRIRDESTGGFNLNRGLLVPDFFGEDNGVDPLSLEVREDMVTDLPDFSFLSDFLLLSADPEQNYRMSVTYDLTIAQEQTMFAPGIAENNTGTTITEFSDYFAYDDGTAEQFIEGGNGLRVVQRYENFVADELTGIRIRIPRGLNTISDQNIRLIVYTGDEEPEEEVGRFDFPILFAEDFFRDSLQGFTSYALPEPIELAEGPFFVGWEQIRNDDRVGIGYDRSNATDGLIYFNSGSGWQEFAAGDIPGVLMIRPLMSGADIQPTSTEDAPPAASLTLYPNPTDGLLLIDRPADLEGRIDYRLFSASGRLMESGLLGRTVDLSRFAPGLYVLETMVAGEVGRYKVVVR